MMYRIRARRFVARGRRRALATIGFAPGSNHRRHSIKNGMGDIGDRTGAPPPAYKTGVSYLWYSTLHNRIHFFVGGLQPRPPDLVTRREV